MKRFVLIDGNAIVHRAYHAMPGFTTSKGKPVGAVYGFTSMLLRAISDLKPDYLAVAFDHPKPTFRKLLYTNYQSTRSEMDDELSSQFAGIYKILTSLTIPMFGVDGFEADDVIGTIAKKVVAKTKNTEVYIVSGDRDLLQLVNAHIKVYMPIKGLTETKLYGEKDVEEKYGLKPSQVIDLKALMGDASDNYPGVAGIGPKTATLLLQKYGTLERVYKNLGEISERQRMALANDAEAAGMGKKLATIVTDVPFQFKVEKCTYKIKDTDEAINVFLSFEFRTLTDRLLSIIEGKPIDPTSLKLRGASGKSTLKVTPKKKDADQLSLI